MNGNPYAPALKRVNIWCSVYSSIVTWPASTARRNALAMPNSSRLTMMAITLLTQPAAISQSSPMPPTTIAAFRSRLPARIISRTSASGLICVPMPWIAMVSPSRIMATACAALITLFSFLAAISSPAYFFSPARLSTRNTWQVFFR